MRKIMIVLSVCCLGVISMSSLAFSYTCGTGDNTLEVATSPKVTMDYDGEEEAFSLMTYNSQGTMSYGLSSFDAYVYQVKSIEVTLPDAATDDNPFDTGNWTSMGGS